MLEWLVLKFMYWQVRWGTPVHVANRRTAIFELVLHLIVWFLPVAGLAYYNRERIQAFFRNAPNPPIASESESPTPTPDATATPAVGPSPAPSHASTPGPRARDSRGMRVSVARSFRQKGLHDADLDGDGLLSEKEYEKLIEFCDKNRDGKLLDDELKLLRRSMAYTHTHYMAKHQDENEDGFVDQNELYHWYQKQDQNQDGNLDAGELRASMRLRYVRLEPSVKEKLHSLKGRSSELTD